jgi:hypothetical protein
LRPTIPLGIAEVGEASVMLEERLAVVVIVVDVVVHLATYDRTPSSYPTIKANMAAPPHNVIAALPL